MTMKTNERAKMSIRQATLEANYLHMMVKFYLTNDQEWLDKAEEIALPLQGEFNTNLAWADARAAHLAGKEL